MKHKKVSLFRDLFKSTDVPFTLTIEEVVNRINGTEETNTKNLVEQIRNGNKELKKKLPSLVFAGQFKHRSKKGLIKHSGLMCLDFDKYESKEAMQNHLELLKQNKHFVLLFVSPSGNGLKGVVRIPECKPKEHTLYFKGFQNKFNYDYFDEVTSDIARVCFESYDPNIYVNYEAELFDCELIEQGFSFVDEREPIMPVHDDNYKIEKIEKFNVNFKFIDGQRNNYIFNLASFFCEYGVNQTTAEGHILTNYCIGDFTENEGVKAVRSAYRSRSFNSKYFEDYRTINLIKKDLNKGEKYVKEKYKIQSDAIDIIKEEKDSWHFWKLDKNNKPSIDSLAFKKYLESQGYRKYFNDGSDNGNLVKMKSSVISLTSSEKIRDFVLNELDKVNEYDVWNVCANSTRLFNDNFLSMLEPIELMMLKDTNTESYFAYKNGVLKVTKDEKKLIPFRNIEGYIWEGQIIDRDFIFVDNKENDYKKFIFNISGENTKPIECTLGYLLSTYKNKMNNKAIILNDEVISSDPEGGTGKGLFVQGVKQIRNVSVLDGKQHDDTKSFAYQTVTQECQVLVIDDAIKNFDFEKKFSLVTEGITLERKGKDAVKLSVEDSPKLLISTNYAIKGDGNSHARRRHEIEVAQYYNSSKTPFDEFGRELFNSWSKDEFNAFDNYMSDCVQLFLINGLIEQYNAKNLLLRKFISSTGIEFKNWVTDENNIKVNQRFNKKEAYTDFTEDYTDFKNKLNHRTFIAWLKKYAKFKGYEWNEGNSNGSRYAEFIDANQPIQNDVPF